MRLFILLIILIILSIQPTLALEINASKTSYLPEETFQVNISGEFVAPLSVSNIFFIKQEKEVELAFYLLKISDKEYWVYVDLPKQTGNYTFAIKNALYKEDGVLKGTEKKLEFEIKQTISYFYSDIKEKITGKLQSLGIEDNALAVIALSYDTFLDSQLKDALFNKKNAVGCWPSLLPCTVKDTAIALFALKKTSANVDASWLIDAQNNLDIGLWNLVISSIGDNQCDIYVDSEKKAVNVSSGDNVVSLDLKNKPDDDVNIAVNCSVTNSKITHTYLGKVNEFAMQKENGVFTRKLNNKKCFGQFYRSDCDKEVTSYALLALDAFGSDKSDTFNWFKNNAETTKERAIALYFGDSNMKDWLLNNQNIDGYWSTKSIIESTQPDINATTFVVWALKKIKEDEASLKGELWLKNNIYGNLSNELAAAVFVFPSSSIESILSVNPAVIKTGTNSNISIVVKNRGITDLSVSANFIPFKTKKDFSIGVGKTERIEFAVPSKIDNKEIKENITGSVEIAYTKFLSGRYSIPVLITAGKNATTDFFVEIPKEHFRFLQQEVNITLLTNEKNLIPVTIKNSGQNAIKDASISYSRDLNTVINITPLHIKEIDAGTEFTVNLLFQSQKVGNYEGFIEVAGSGFSAVLPINVTFTKNESLVTIDINKTITEKNKTCKDYNGTICKKDETCKNNVITSEGKCCIAKCEGKKNTRLLGILMIGVAVLIIVLSLIFKMRKPKKEMKNIVEEIEKKYDKFTPQKRVP